MLHLKEYISNTLTLLKALKEQKNRYYYNSATGVTGTYQTTFTVCTLNDLPVGTYLVLGYIGANVGASTIMNAALGVLENSTMIVNTGGKTTLLAGGGCHTWGIASVDAEPGSLRLTTYRYYSGTIGYSGKLVAIRLI